MSCAHRFGAIPVFGPPARPAEMGQPSPSLNAKYRHLRKDLDDRPAEPRRSSRGPDGDDPYLALVTGKRPDGAPHFC